MSRVNLKGVDTSIGCAKPNCQTDSRTLNRHHRKHQAMWLGVWVSRRRGEARWASFVQRYWQFHADDVVLICISHHAEIHEIYDKIIEADKKRLGKSLARYTWAEAEALMSRLENACREWEKKQTPGSDPFAYTAKRQRQRVAKNKKNRERQTRNRNH